MDCLAIQTKILNEIDTHYFGGFLEDSLLVLFIASTQQKMILENTWIPNLAFTMKMVEACQFLKNSDLASIITDSYIADQARLQNVEFVAKSRDGALKRKIIALLDKIKFTQDLSDLNENELMFVLSELTIPFNF
jgi:hypothetical protein